MDGPSLPLGRFFSRWMSAGQPAPLCVKAALREGGPRLALTLADALIGEGEVGELAAAPAVGATAVGASA
jgi:hypothetical protein